MEKASEPIYILRIVPVTTTGGPLESWMLFYNDGTIKCLDKTSPPHLQSPLLNDVRDFQRKVVWQMVYAREIREWAMNS